MRRCPSIHLAIMTVASAAVWCGCGRRDEDSASQPITSENTYTNNHYTPGAGYYHAPYRAWFPVPFNHFDPSRGYFRGGQWSPSPESAPTLASRPDPAAAAVAEQQRRAAAPSPANSGTRRSGFGSSSRPVWS